MQKIIGNSAFRRSFCLKLLDLFLSDVHTRLTGFIADFGDECICIDCVKFWYLENKREIK